MNAIRAFRRMKEQERERLANRVHLLQLELEKSNKKIEDTQKRVENINTSRQRLEERMREKEEVRARK